MSTVKFSVVIPTRERAETLRFALGSCLDQSFDDYEVIVSDNFSSAPTREVAEAAGSPRVRYVRTPEPLALSRSWEFAVAHARGEYVLLIGDDDGLLPHALRELDAILTRTGARAVRWDAAFYTWPAVALPGQGNYLRVPMSRSLTARDGGDAIRQAVAFRDLYTELPMLYNAAVRRDVLAELRTRTGCVFPHRYPDVYSGLAVAYVAGRFLSAGVPMTVSGLSAASTGVATLFGRGRNPIDDEFHALNARDGFRPEPRVPDLPVFPQVPVADAFAFAKRVLFPELDADVDRTALARACVARTRVSESDWPAALGAVRAALSDSEELRAWFDRELADTPYRAPEPVELRPAALGFDGTYLHLDAAALGVRDVAAAARLCEHLLDYRHRPVEYTEGDDADPAARKIAALTAACDARQHVIVRLDSCVTELRTRIRDVERVCGEREQIIRRADGELKELGRQLADAKRWSVQRPLRAVQRVLGTIGLG